MNSHWKAILGILLIFLFGCVSGWLSRSVVAYRQTAQFFQRGPEAMVELVERRVTRNLDLDPNQNQQIHACLMENLTQRKQLQFQIQPQVQMLNLRTLQQINAVLRPDQQQRFHDNLAQFRKRFGKSPFNPNAGDQPVDAPVANPGTTNTPPH